MVNAADHRVLEALVAAVAARIKESAFSLDVGFVEAVFLHMAPSAHDLFSHGLSSSKE